MIIIAVVTYVYPWQQIVSGHVRTEVAFERTFGSHAIAQLILFGAFLSLLKIFNGNFVAATRMLYAIGRRNLVHPALGRVHARSGTPVVAITLMGLLTAAAAMFGDAILVPITEVGSLAVGVGWLSACAAYLARRRRDGYVGEPAAMAGLGCAVSVAIVLMKVVPGVPGSFTRAEWITFLAWSAAGLAFWLLRRPVNQDAIRHEGGSRFRPLLGSRGWRSVTRPRAPAGRTHPAGARPGSRSCR